ncbi:hypothetical protein PT974_00345 [Cladobotryum mycophilum]|uniref:DUF7918 domain-containing protein n=1 Tax=Cladobotryum mycophilum TaxID=491253 RepID=A0ABR0T0N7_9HYPO
MAVIPEIPGIKVNVKVAGQVAKEYAAPDDEEASCSESDVPSHSCYIESITGSRFTVEVKFTKEFKLPRGKNCASAELSLDGEYVEGTFEDESSLKSLDPCCCIFDAMYTKSRKRRIAIERNFIFGSVSSVEDGDKTRVTRDAKIAKSLGIIEIKITAGINGGVSQFVPVQRKDPRGFQLAEKSMKGMEISHGASFIWGKTVEPPATWCAESEGDICQFTFMYRSHDALKRMMIIPRSPSPSPEPVRGDADELENLTLSEIRELARETLRSKKGNIVKREREEGFVDGKNLQSRPLKMTRIEGNQEAVDLTND